MLIHLDTSVLVDAFSGERRLLPRVRAATVNGDVLSFSTIVLYEWLRGPRTDEETQAVDAVFEMDTLADFGRREAARAARLYRHIKNARQRQADVAIAACALEHDAQLWTLNRVDFTGIPALTLYKP